MSEPAAPAPGEWRRTSRLGLLVRMIVNMRNAVFAVAAVMFGSRSTENAALFVLPTVAMILGLWLFASWIAWRRFRYRLGDSDIRVEQGLLNRTARSVPYERIQDVSLEQSLVPRLFGMVEVKFETGAGGKDELKIGYITEAEGAALRETVRAHRMGEVAVADTETVAEPEGRTLFVMGLKRLVTFGLFEFSLVVFAVLGGAAQQFDFLLPFDLWNFEDWIRVLAGPGHWLQELGIAAQVIGAAVAFALLGVVGLVTGLGRTVLRDYGFRLEETPKGLRRRRGLFTRTDVVMPLHRVQALKVTTGCLRRLWGWHGLSVVSLATDAKSANHVVVPFAQMEEIAPVAAVTGFELPGEAIEWRRPSARHRFDEALFAVIPFGLAAVAVPTLNGLFGQPLALPLLASVALATMAALFAVREWYLWRHDRHAIDEHFIYARRGWLAPRLDIASRVKLQSVEIAQGPIARRRGYADLKLGIAGGTLEIGGIPVEDARAIRAAVLGSIASVDFSQLGEAAQSEPSSARTSAQSGLRLNSATT